MEVLGRIILYRLLVFFALCGEVQGIHWTGKLSDVDHLFTCKGSNVTLPWTYDLDNDVVTDIEWYFQEVSEQVSEEVIAFLIHGQFFPYPAFSGRVSLTENAGISLTDLLPGDSGNYSVVVKGHDDSGQYFELKKTITIHVSDQVMTSHGSQLHLLQSSEPVLDTVTGQWAVQLLCGQFAFQAKPSYDVQWIFPDGLLHSSAGFNGSYFSLLLTGPVLGGSYTCRVPRQHSCINGQGLVRTEDSIQVNGVEIRLALLEKLSSVENHQLKAQKEQLEDRLNLTERRLEDVTGELHRVSQELNGTGRWLEDVTGELNRVTRVLNETTGDLQELKEWKRTPHPPVAFHATFWKYDPANKFATTPMVFANVTTNEGLGYDNATGYFTAPYNGTYAFVSKSVPENDGGWLGLYLIMNAHGIGPSSSGKDVQIDWVEVYWAKSSSSSTAVVHGVVDLNSGDRVWVSCGWSDGEGGGGDGADVSPPFPHPPFSAFSGAMVSFADRV